MNTIQQRQTHYNNTNKTHFKALKGMKYKGDFNPEKHIADAKAVLEFKESKLFTEFFNKYDGVAEFSKENAKMFKNDYCEFSNITYKNTSHAKLKHNSLQRTLQRIRKFLSPQKDENKILGATQEHEPKSDYYAFLSIKYKNKTNPEHNLLKRGQQSIKKYDNELLYSVREQDKDAVSISLANKIKWLLKENLTDEIEMNEKLAQLKLKNK